jgi:NADPH:quinone reductase-like Zn-dependent oxidoreductase
MRVVSSVSPPSLVEAEGPEPQAGRGELLIRVHAAGVTPTELDWYPTSHRKSGEKRAGAIPGHEFSGVIAVVGDEVADLAVGEEVYGMNDWFMDGATAEYCTTQPQWLAPKPRNLTHAEAASVPIGALTAWQGLFDRARLQAGERVLIHGGAGAVGMFAVQLARWRGAHVVATASARNLEFVASLGAEQTIDYRAGRFENIAREIDVVFDAVGGDTLQRSLAVLRPGGRMITIAGGAEGSSDPLLKEAFFIVEPNRGQLVEIGKLLEEGRIRTVVGDVLPFSQAPAAYAGNRSGRGKQVLAIA